MNRRIAHAAVAATAAVALTAAPAVTASAQESLPAQTQDARGDTYYLNREGTYYVRTLQEAAKPYAQLDSAQQEKAVAVLDAAVAGLIGTGVIRDQPADQPTGATPAPVPAAAESQVPTAAETQAPATTTATATTATTASPDPATTAKAPEQAVGTSDVDPSNPAPVAAGLVKFPPVLVLAGTTYYLNKDGHTFVADISRVNADVTPEETAQSEALVQANAGEVGKQGLEAARAGGEADVATPYAAARGLEAETGSNTLVRALFALVLAGALGAAFFGVARRRLM